MQIINQTEALADMLGKRSVFQNVSASSFCPNSEYGIFMGVPVHCLTVNHSDINCARDFPYHVIDLLICRGKEAILAIVLDAEYRDMEKLFSTHLKAVPHMFLKSDELTYDVMEDLSGRIECQLRADSANPLHTDCMLYTIRVRHAVSRMDAPDIKAKIQGTFWQFLKEKHLIKGDGSVTAYGHACGMFQHWLAGSERSIYATVPQAIDKLKQAMLWRDRTSADFTLANRLARLKQGLPSDSAGQGAEMLKKLLHTPLEVLFENHPQEGHHLNTLLNHAQFLSRESSISAFGDREEIESYGDVIYAVRNLWEYTARGDCRNGDAAGTCEQILAYLSLPFWNLILPKTRWERRDAGVNNASFATMPLSHYFYAAACLTESEYPLWLYRTCTQPWLSLYASGELSFAKAVQEAYALSQSEDENEKADCFPLMYDILVEPVSGLV